MADIRITKPGIYQIDSQTYHSDAFLPSLGLSSGIAKTLISRSPAHAWASHAKNSAFQSENKQQWDLGSAAHAILLEGEANIIVIDADDYRGGQAKLLRDAAYLAGKIPVLTHQLQECRQFAKAIRDQLDQHQTDSGAFKNGKPEQTLIWQEKNGVWCKIRPDWTQDDLSFVDHLKTTGTSVNPESIGRWAFDQGHHIIDAFYRRGFKAVHGKEVPGRFIVSENDPPFATVVYTLPKEVMQKADQMVELAIATWCECLSSGKWPAYPPYRIEIDVPPWATIAWESRIERAKFEGADKFDPTLAKMLAAGNIGG